MVLIGPTGFGFTPFCGAGWSVFCLLGEKWTRWTRWTRWTEKNTAEGGCATRAWCNGCHVGRALRKLRELGVDGRRRMGEVYPGAYAVLKWEGHRERGREDFWYFLTQIVGNPVLYEPLHKPLARRLEPWNWGPKQNKLILWPRGHLKTSVAVQAHTVWQITRNPEIRVLVGSHRADDAVASAGVCRAILDSDEYRAVYPEIRPAMQDGKVVCWRDDQFRVERKSKLKEHTVETASPGVKLTGKHYNVIKPDDIVNEDTVRSRTAMQKTTDFMKYLVPLLDPGGHVLMTGTRYDYGDEYGRIIAEESQDWDITVRKAVEHGEVIYPTRFHLGPEHEGDPDNDTAGRFSLPKLKVTLGPYIYHCQYENEPADDSNATFQRGDIKVVQELPAHRSYVFGRSNDLSGEGETESATAIVDWAVDDLANLYIIHIVWEQMDPSRIINHLIAGQRKPEHARPTMVTGEKAAIERVLKHFLDKATRETGVLIPWKWLPTTQSQKSKLQRVLGFEPWWSAGRVHVLASCPHREDMIDQFVRYPRSGDMDIADAMAQIPVMMWPAGKEVEVSAEEKAEAQTRAWFEEQFGAWEDEGDERYWIGEHSVMDVGRGLGILG